MKKIVIVFILFLLVFLVGCDTNNKQNASTNDNKQNDTLDNSKENKTTIVNVGDTFTKKWETKIWSIEKNKEVNIELEVEIEIVSKSYEKEVYSDSENMFAQYFPEQDEELYYVVEFVIKNLSGDIITEREFENAKLKNEYLINNKYKYQFQWLDSTNSAMSSFFAIDPLKKLKVYSVALIPKELNESEPEIFFIIGDEQYIIKP